MTVTQRRPRTASASRISPSAETVFSRVGRLNATESEVDLGATLDEAIGNVATAVEESGTEIVRPRRLPRIMGDPTLLTMLWQNLIGNAVKFRRDGVAPRIVVDCEEGSDDRDGARQTPQRSASASADCIDSSWCHSA